MRNNIMKKINEQKYDLMFSHRGNGLGVSDRSREKNNDYLPVAHISDDGKIDWYDKKMPSAVKSKIIKQAKSWKKKKSNESMVREIIKKEINEVNYSDRLARTLVNSKLVKKGMSEKELFGPIFKQAKKDFGDKKAKYLMGHDHDFLSDTLQAISNLIEAYTHSGDDKLVSLNVRTPKIKYKIGDTVEHYKGYIIKITKVYKKGKYDEYIDGKYYKPHPSKPIGIVAGSMKLVSISDIKPWKDKNNWLKESKLNENNGHDVELHWQGLSGNDAKIGRFIVSPRVYDKMEKQFHGHISLDLYDDEVDGKQLSWNQILQKIIQNHYTYQYG